MDLQLQDKVVFVAGGSRGIGLGIVEACLTEGAWVAITAGGSDALEATRRRRWRTSSAAGPRLGASRDMRKTRPMIEAALDGG